MSPPGNFTGVSTEPGQRAAQVALSLQKHAERGAAREGSEVTGAGGGAALPSPGVCPLDGQGSAISVWPSPWPSPCHLSSSPRLSKTQPMPQTRNCWILINAGLDPSSRQLGGMRGHRCQPNEGVREEPAFRGVRPALRILTEFYDV